MWNDILHSFVPFSGTWYGRMRTLELCAPVLEKIARTSPIPLRAEPTWMLPATVGWDFIRQHQLEWAIEADVQDEVVRREFLRHPLPESVRGGLRTFLQNSLPGLLLLDAVFKGEDMGAVPYPHLFPRRYVVDPNLSIVERLRVLEQSIKEIMAMVFFEETKKCLAGLLLPLEDWMVSIAVTDIATPRRGSFYYPDMTAVIWTGEENDAHGLLVPGWWEPRHPHFPAPVAFRPGDAIGPGPQHLLALETRMGTERMVLIPRHLAKTHGTMNLTPVKEESEVASERSAMVQGENSPLSELTQQLIEGLTAELGIPLNLQLMVQPNVNTGASQAVLTCVKPYTPPRLKRAISVPQTGLVELILEKCPSRGSGAAFARYILMLDELPSPDQQPGLLQFLRALEGMGEAALVLSRHTLPEDLWDLFVQSHAVVAVCAPNGNDHGMLPGLLHFICDCRRLNKDILMANVTPLANPDGLSWFVVPKPLRMASSDGTGDAWL